MHDKSILVIVALPEEMKYVYDHVESRGGKCAIPYDPKIRTYPFTIPISGRKKIPITFHVLEEMGNVRASTGISAAIGLFRPELCFLLGIAGSLDINKFRLGDVAISASSKSYYADKIKEIDRSKEQFWDVKAPLLKPSGGIAVDDRKRYLQESFFRYRRDAVRIDDSEHWISRYLYHISSTPPLLAPVNQWDFPKIDTILLNAHPKVDPAIIFGSEMVLDSEEYVNFILEKNQDESLDYYTAKAGGTRHPRQRTFRADISVVDMESFGFFALIEAIRPTTRISYAFSVRGISDLAFGKEHLDDNTSDGIRKIAAINAAEVTMDIIDYLFRYVII